jgi:NTE family protein
MREANLENTRRIAIIIVDAQIQEAAHWQALDEVPGLGTIIGASSTILINKYNFETIELLNHLARDWSLNDKAQGLEPINFYIVHVSFDALSDQKDRDYFNDIPTSLYLPGEQVDRLRQAASEILYNNKQFQKLVTDLGGIMPYTNGTLKERGVRQEAKTGEPQEEELAP